MAKGSVISRVRDYFKNAPLDEVEVVFALVTKDVAGRKVTRSAPVSGVTKKRVSRAKPAAVPAVAPAPAATQQEVA